MLATFWSTAAAAVVIAAVALTIGWRARRRWVGRVLAVGLLLAAAWPAALAGYLGVRWAAGQPEARTLHLANGVIYERLVATEPRPYVAHVVRIDLQAGHRLVVTPPLDTPDGRRNLARVTTDALAALDADVAINASFFRPFRDQWFLDYAPHSGDPVEPVGATVADGVRYGLELPAQADWPALCVDDAGAVRLGGVDDATRWAVSGIGWLLRDGRPQGLSIDPEPYPRTAVGLDAAARTMWWVLVDGKQPRYSEGVTLDELTALLRELGATDAINLDGGGSVTLATTRTGGGPVVLNRPAHTKIPGRQRPVASHLGLRVVEP